jgi:hypothetical protein
VSRQVLHLDFIKLILETGPDQRRQLEDAAAQLSAIDGVVGVGVIEAATESDFDLAFWFLLREFIALEPFGTDPRYSRFLQGSVAPLLRSFAGADVQLEDKLEASDGPAACIALIGPEEAYDFEVREALEAWTETTGAGLCAIGLAVGERQIYRGAALAFGATNAETYLDGPFRPTLIRGRARSL